MVLCWAFGCSHYNEKDDCKFFRFPKELKQKKSWIKLLRRTDEPGQGARICSCHFRDGIKNNGPTILLHRSHQFNPHHLTPEKKKKRDSIRKITTMQADSNIPEDDLLNHESISATNTVNDIGDEPLDLSLNSSSNLRVQSKRNVQEMFQNVNSSNAVDAENYFLQKENEELKLKLHNLAIAFTYENLSQNDDLINSYTGLPSNAVFMALHNLVKNIELNYYLKWSVVTISKPDQILMTLIKLRHNFPHFDLSVRFKCSQATVSNIIITWINILHDTLFSTLMKKMPSRYKIKTCLPNAFKSFPNCRVIIDCTEIYTSVSRKSMNIQRDTYSSYKHRNTWKVLIGIAPNGVVTFVSSLYPGSTSDKIITLKSGILEQLVPGDVVMADKGFLIGDILPPGVLLNIPPFLDTPQFTPQQILQTESIAKARIHIERAIQRIKCYKILDFIPYTMLKQAEYIFKVVAALTNLHRPLLNEVQESM